MDSKIDIHVQRFYVRHKYSIKLVYSRKLPSYHLNSCEKIPVISPRQLSADGYRPALARADQKQRSRLAKAPPRGCSPVRLTLPRETPGPIVTHTLKVGLRRYQAGVRTRRTRLKHLHCADCHPLCLYPTAGHPAIAVSPSSLGSARARVSAACSDQTSSCDPSFDSQVGSLDLSSETPEHSKHSVRNQLTYRAASNACGVQCDTGR